MRKINPTKLIVDNYSTEEVIAYVTEHLQAEIDFHFAEESSHSRVYEYLDVLKALNAKLGGKKSSIMV